LKKWFYGLKDVKYVSKYRLRILKWDNINWAPKQIKNDELKVLFGRLKKLFDHLIKLLDAEDQSLKEYDYPYKCY